MERNTWGVGRHQGLATRRSEERGEKDRLTGALEDVGSGFEGGCWCPKWLNRTPGGTKGLFLVPHAVSR